MRQYEADTFYDQNGRIVFTASKGLPGVGFSRAEWDAIKDMTAGTVQRQVLDTTLRSGPIERTLTYQAPFTKRNREQDYAMVWAVLDRQEHVLLHEEDLPGNDRHFAAIKCQYRQDGTWSLWTELHSPLEQSYHDRGPQIEDQTDGITDGRAFIDAFSKSGVAWGTNPDLATLEELLPKIEQRDPRLARSLREAFEAHDTE
jgi:hypothetical protein